MEKSLELIKKANIVPVLRLAQQVEGGGVQSTGRHVVTLVKDALSKRINPRTGKEEYIVWYYVKEDGIEKRYAVPVKDDNGELHYLVQRLGVLKPGTEVALEYKRKGMKGYIAVEVLSENSEEPQATALTPEGISPELEEDSQSSLEEKDENISPDSETVW
jgi:hypothetical protein